MKTVITASAAADFLALVPELVGFWPSESIVLVVFRGTQSCAALRADLPSSAEPGVVAAFACSLVGLACKIPGANALVPVVYSSASFGPSSLPPHGDLVDAQIFQAEHSGFLVRDALCVANDGWGSYLDASTPIGGHPLRLVSESLAAEQLVRARALSAPNGGAEAEQNGPIVVQQFADRAVRLRVGKLIKRIQQGENNDESLPAPATGLVRGTQHAREAARVEWASIAAAAEKALTLTADSLTDHFVAHMLWAMQNPATRDALLLHWAFGPAADERASLENGGFSLGKRGLDSAVARARLLWGEGPRPDPIRVASAIALLSALVARAPRINRVAPLSMVAWLNWALGRSSRAAAYVRMSFEIDESYGFARILDRMLSAGHLPEWAFAVPFSQGDHPVAE